MEPTTSPIQSCSGCGGLFAATAETPHAAIRCPFCGLASSAETAAPAPAGLRESPESIFQDTATVAVPAYEPVAHTGAAEKGVAESPTPDADIPPVPPLIAARGRVRRRIPLSAWLLVLIVPYCIASSVGLWMLYAQLKAARAANDKPGTTPEPDAAPRTEAALKLGDTRRLGGTLEITPIEVRRVKSIGRARPAANGEVRDVLALRLRIKNISKGVVRPLHPEFNRDHAEALTVLDIDGVKFFGPAKDPALERYDGQYFPELLPGMESETLLIAARDSRGGGVLPHFDHVKDNTPLIWHIALIRTLGEPLGRDSLSAVSIVPVTFTKAMVSGLVNGD